MAATTETLRHNPGLDIIGSLMLLACLTPLFLIIGAAIWITMGRPVLYRWKVVGQGGVPFTGYKFRTMVPNADQLKSALVCRNEMTGPAFKIKCDPRVTPLGRTLRRLSLDELPQLWSVLKGDMSLVGPRPPLQTEWPHFADWQRRKLSVKPGMTCLWQVNGRNNIASFDDWIRLDLHYIDNWSLLLDFKILLLTILAVGTGRGAS
jgi:lipopolysaccharide/colanic/teichoic acid biosynthesis glycosyltransferase